MTFKSIDLQMSIPRTQEFSGMQSQANHKPVADQNTLADQTAKHTEQLRSKNTNIEQTTGLHVRSEQDGHQGNAYRNTNRKRQEDETIEKTQEQAPAHPFKGHHLDIKL